MSMLVVGIVLMVGGLAFAVYPFLRRSSGEDAQEPSDSTPPAAHRRTPMERASATAADALANEREELALDRAMGKLSDEDYQRMLAALDARARRTVVTAPAAGVAAAASLPASPDVRTQVPSAPVARAPLAASSLEEEAERLVRAERAVVVACPDCGPRPEPAARFCSSCGRSLGGCPRCGADVREAAARFCDQCGTPLRA